MADEEQQTLPPGSSYLFNADAQAILEESPDLDTGLNLLTESYAAKAWDDKKAASTTAASYATQLRQRFEEPPDYSEEETVSLAPVDLPVIKASGDAPVSTVVDQINTWESSNLQFLDETEDPDYVVMKDKLTNSIKNHASEMRRQSQGKDTSWLGDKFNRAQEGLTSGIAKLVGAEEYLKNLHEHTNPSADDDLSSAIASGAGSFVGAVGAGIPTAGYGTLAYLAATGAGEVKGTYEESLKATGDTQRAKVAGALEVGSQALQTVVGHKIFGKLGGTISKRFFGKEVEKATESAVSSAVKGALAEGTTETAGGVVSNYARQYGTNNPNIGVFDGAGNNFAVGAVFGGAATGLDAVLSRSRATPEEGVAVTETVTDPIEKTVIGAPVDLEATQAVQQNSAAVNVLESEGALPPAPVIEGDFMTADGNRYSRTPEGATSRTKNSTQEQFLPLDRTFFLDKEKANALAALRNQVQPDGATPQILTDGERLIVKGDYVQEDLSISDTPTGRSQTVLEALEEPAVGSHPVEVNRPKNLNGNEKIYQSHIGKEITALNPRTVFVESEEGSSVGASFTKERKLGLRLRLSEGLDEDIRSGFGDSEGGFLRYLPVPRADTGNQASRFIAENGVANAVTEVLSLPETHADATSVEMSRQLIEILQTGGRAARAAGDLDNAGKLMDLAINLGDKAARILTNAGRTVDIARLWNSFDPGLRIVHVRRKIKEAALTEVGAEEGLSRRDLESLDTDIEAIQEKADVIEAEGKKLAQEADAAKPKVEGKPSKPSDPEQFLTPDQKQELSDLRKEKEKLEARREKRDSKVRERQKKFSPEQEQRLEKLLTAARKTGGTLQQKLLRDASKIEQTVADDTPQKNSLWHTMWIANQLSDPSTQAVNLIGNAYQVASNVLSYTATGVLKGTPLDGARFLNSFIRAARNEGTDAFFTELKGVRTFRPNAEKLDRPEGQVNTKGVDTRDDLVTEAPAWVKKVGLNNLGYVFRMLSATDAGFYKSLQEAQAEFIARDAGTRKNLSGTELKNYVSEQLYNSTENWNNAERAAKAEASLLEELGYKQDARQVRLRAWEILEQKRPEALREEVHTFASKATFTNTPEGVVGGIVRGMSAMANAPLTIGGKEIKPLRYVFAFLNVAGNILNANIDHTPLGALRALDPELSALEKRNQIGKFMVGTVMASTIYGIAREFQNDDDPYFAIYAEGPTDANKNRQWRDTGARPYSVKIGDNYVQYKETPFGLMLGALGAWMDAERYNKGYARQSGVAALSTVLGGMGNTFINNSFLKNMADFIDGIQGKDGKNPVDAILVNPIKGFVPFAGSLRAITKLVQDPIETYGSFWAKFSSGIPFVQKLGNKPALNAFGEPVERTFEDRLSFIGRFYSERVTDPDWRWLAENNYNIPDAGGFTVEIPTKGKATAAQRGASLGAAFEGVLTQEERYEYMKRQGPQVRAIIAQYRQKYAGSGHQEKVQDQLSRAIGDIRSRVKREMFLK